jgi:beta-glucanase (GH16 family)
MRIPIQFLPLLPAIVPLIAHGQCWQRVWHDEFNGDSIATNKWTFETGGGGWGNQELETYTAQNAQVSGGRLLISALKDSSGFTSARMKTAGHAFWKYGRFEALMKLPSAPGMWPAFWMMPEDSVYGGWPRSGEIDIVEVVGQYPNRSYATVHTVDAKGAHVSFGDSTDLSSGVFAAGFHVFSLEWDAGSMRFALDGTVYATRLRPLPGGATWPFDQPFYFILNLAVGGNWPGPPTAATVFPQVMEVDWVRVSQKLEDIAMTGHNLVVPGARKKRYELPQIHGAAYDWTLPDGAAITSGGGSHAIHVDWGTASSGDVAVTITTDCGAATKTMTVTVTPNLWVNPSFVDGFANWGENGAGKFEILADAADGDNHAARVTVSQPGQFPWSVQLLRSGLKLKKDVLYTVSFFARSDMPRSIPFSFIDSTTYATFATRKIALTTDWTEYSLTFTQPSDATALFTIDLAASAGVYDFDDFQFTRQ